jgi:hypothetical protein
MVCLVRSVYFDIYWSPKLHFFCLDLELYDVWVPFWAGGWHPTLLWWTTAGAPDSSYKDKSQKLFMMRVTGRCVFLPFPILMSLHKSTNLLMVLLHSLEVQQKTWAKTDWIWNTGGSNLCLLTCCLTFLFLLQVIEKQRLIEFAEALHSKLKYFDELENVRFECNLNKSLSLFWYIVFLLVEETHNKKHYWSNGTRFGTLFWYIATSSFPFKVIVVCWNLFQKSH